MCPLIWPSMSVGIPMLYFDAMLMSYDSSVDMAYKSGFEMSNTLFAASHCFRSTPTEYVV